MKIEQSKSIFSPITIVLETVTELDWLRAASNVSVTEANARAKLEGFEIRGTSQEISAAQMTIYRALESIQR
ncbi:hypothetical protein 16Q_119 [Pseudomonas phage 16Q]|nr:hypothetical protein 16Q_119 [Pseudomonas phage 16Q]